MVAFSVFAIAECGKVNTNQSNNPVTEKVETTQQNNTNEIKPYGKLVQVKGKNMNTYTIGQEIKILFGFQVIVIMQQPYTIQKC